MVNSSERDSRHGDRALEEGWCTVKAAAGMCCERCPGATLANTRHIARRRLLKAAVFQPQQDATGLAPARPGSADHDAGPRRAKILQSSLTLQASAATPAPPHLSRPPTAPTTPPPPPPPPP